MTNKNRLKIRKNSRLEEVLKRYFKYLLITKNATFKTKAYKRKLKHIKKCDNYIQYLVTKKLKLTELKWDAWAITKIGSTNFYDTIDCINQEYRIEKREHNETFG